MNEQPLSRLAVYNPRPTVVVDTRSYPLVDQLLLGMEMTEQEGGLSALELRLSNFASRPDGSAGFAFEDGAVLDLGASVQVYAGDSAGPAEIFLGRITGLELDFGPDGPPELVVLAEDAFQQGRMTRRTRVYENKTLAELLSDFARELGLTPRIDGLEQPLGTQVQLNESDLAFVRRLAARYGTDFQVVGDELHAAPIGERRRGEVTLTMHSQLQKARVLADLSQQVTRTTVTGWDAARGTGISESASGTHLGPGRGRTGADVLAEKLHERPHHISHAAAATSAEARALAQTAFDARAHRFVTLEGVAEGNPAIRVGTHVNVMGLGRRFDNTYSVTNATHLYDLDRGYRTRFEATCAYWGG